MRPRRVVATFEFSIGLCEWVISRPKHRQIRTPEAASKSRVYVKFCFLTQRHLFCIPCVCQPKRSPFQGAIENSTANDWRIEVFDTSDFAIALKWMSAGSSGRLFEEPTQISHCGFASCCQTASFSNIIPSGTYLGSTFENGVFGMKAVRPPCAPPSTDSI